MENRQLLTEASIKEWFAKFNLSDSQKEDYLNLIKSVPYAQKYLGKILTWVIGGNELKEDVIFYLGEFEKNISQIKNKDMYSREYDSFEYLKKVINSLPKWYDKVDIPKEVKKGLERFKDEAFIVHETDAYYGIYLGSYAASYYFCYNPRRYNDYLRATQKGKRINPGWCIGQPRTRNYYDSQGGDVGLFFLVIYKKGLEKSNVYVIHPNYFSRWDIMNLQGYSNETEPGFVEKCRSDERVKKIFKLKEKMKEFPTDIITMSVMSGIDIKPDFKSMMNLLEAKYKIEIDEEIKNELEHMVKTKKAAVGEIVQKIMANPKKELSYLWLSSSDSEDFGFYEMLYKTKNLTVREKTDIARSVGNYFQMKQYLKRNYTSYGLNIDDYISEPSKLNYAVIAKFSRLIITNLVEIDKKGMSELYDVVSKFWLKFNESKDFYFFPHPYTTCLYRFLTTNLMTQLFNAYLDNYEVLDKIKFEDDFKNALLEKLVPNDDNEKMIIYLNKHKLFLDKELGLKAISSIDKDKIEAVLEKIDADNRLKTLSSETKDRIVLFFTQMPEFFEKFEKYINIASSYSGGWAWAGETEAYKKVLNLLNENETRIFSELILTLNMSSTEHKFKNLLAVFSAPHQYLKDDEDITSMIAGCISLPTSSSFLTHWFKIKYNTDAKFKDVLVGFFGNNAVPVESQELPKVFNSCKKLIDIATKMPSEQQEKIRWDAMDWGGFLSSNSIEKFGEDFLIKAIIYPYAREHQEGAEEFINNFSLNFLVKARDILHKKAEDDEKTPKILLHFYKIMKGDEEKILKIISEIEIINSNLMLATDEKSLKNLSLFSLIEVDISNEITEDFSAAIKGVEADFVKPFNFYVKAYRSTYSYDSIKPTLTDAVAKNFIKNKDEIMKLIKGIKWFDFKKENYSNSILLSFFNPEEFYELVILKAIASLDFDKIEEAIKKSLEEPITTHSPVIQAYTTSTKDLKKKVKNLLALQEFILNTMVKLTLLIGSNNYWASKNSKRLIKFGHWLVKYGTVENSDGAKYFIYYKTIPKVAEKIKKMDSLGIVNQGYAAMLDNYVMLDDDKLKVLDPYIREILLAFSEGGKDEKIDIKYPYVFRSFLDKPAEEIIKIVQSKTLKQELDLSAIRTSLNNDFEIMSEDSSYFYCLQTDFVGAWEYNSSKKGIILIDPGRAFAKHNHEHVRIVAINKKKFGTNLILEIVPDGTIKKESEYYNDTLAKKLLTIFSKWKTDRTAADYYDRLQTMENRIYAFNKKELQEILFTHSYELLNYIGIETYRNYYSQYVGTDFKIVKEIVDYFKTTIGAGSSYTNWHQYTDDDAVAPQEAMLVDALYICRILANEPAYLAGGSVSHLIRLFNMAGMLAEKVFKPILGTNSLTWEAINKLNLSIEQKTALASFVGAQEPAADAE